MSNRGIFIFAFKFNYAKEEIKEEINNENLSLISHGINVFGSQDAFDVWLDSPNFHFNTKKPSTFLDTATGIKFINDRLTALEQGDNV